MTKHYVIFFMIIIHYTACHYAKQSGYRCSSAYLLCPSIPVYCDMETKGGGWALIQRRIDGRESFNRIWSSYQQGFGEVTREHWLGLDNIRTLLSKESYVLRFDLYSWEGEHKDAEYTKFVIYDEGSNYKIKIEGYSGDAGDAMAVSNGFQFSTLDRENDPSALHCSKSYGDAGWWYNDCHKANLNGYYCRNSTCPCGVGVTWQPWKGYYYSLKGTQMKIREFSISQ